MEVEVKLRLPDKAAHDKVAEVLQASRGARHAQENCFFDGLGGELGEKRLVLRVRFYNVDAKAVVTLKGRSVLQGLVSLGGFHNNRTEFQFEGHKLELDETCYDWGKLYEIEVESSEPEAIKQKLEAMLKENGISYRYSTTTKFANFRNRSLD